MDARLLPAWGIYARNVEQLTLQDVHLNLDHDDLRPVLLADTVQHLALDDFKFPAITGVAQPLVLTNVAKLERR